ncbi:MAG: hypothetical protein IJ899_10175 [Blautia sp.]|nr:hypothetical protein [Blautia sp.]
MKQKTKPRVKHSVKYQTRQPVKRQGRPQTKQSEKSRGNGPERQSMKQKLRESFYAEKQKILALPKGSRLSYILDYYWLWMIGIAAAVFLIGYVGWHALFSVKENWFYAVFANTMADVGNDSELYDGFVSYSSFDLREKNVVFQARSFFDPSREGGTNNSYFQSFVALVETGTVDVVTMEREGLEALGATGRLLDLNHEGCEELREKYADRLVWTLPLDEAYSQEPVPVGIDLTDSKLMTEWNLYPESCCLGIGAYTSHLEAVESFLEYVSE